MRRLAVLVLLVAACSKAGPTATRLILITDVYHPHQDVGDNFDLLTAYAMPTVDLKAVLIDVTDRFRRPVAAPDEPSYNDVTGPREPGIITLHQLNWIFGRNVPFAPGVFRPLRSEDDDARDAPAYQQAGVQLFLDTLRASPSKVEVLVTGSARQLAIALNRDPALLEAKIARVHLSAGATDPDFEEWNVHLDPHAMARVLRSRLPIALYPCAGGRDPFALHSGSSYWSMADLAWTTRAPQQVQAYLHYAFSRSARLDFLRALEEVPDRQAFTALMTRPHHVWETAAWFQIGGFRLVRRGGEPAIVGAHDMRSDDVPFDEGLVPARITVSDRGTFRVDPTGRPITLYRKGDPGAYQATMRTAFPPWFLSLLNLPR